MKKVVILGAIGLLGLGTMSAFLLASNKSILFRAGDLYSCELPDGYNELHDAVLTAQGLAYGAETQTDYLLRGTLTRKSGNLGYLQRVNQQTQVLDAVNVDLSGYAYEVGNVLDIYRPYIYNDNGSCYINKAANIVNSYTVNPTGYGPLRYQGIEDYNNRALVSGYSSEEDDFSYGRLISISGIAVENSIGARASNDSDVISGFTFFNPYENTEIINFEIYTGDASKTNAIVDKLNTLDDEFSLLEVTGILVKDSNGQKTLRIVEEDDIVSIGTYDSSLARIIKSSYESRIFTSASGNYETLDLYKMKGKGDIYYVNYEDAHTLIMDYSYGYYDFLQFSTTHDGSVYTVSNEVGSIIIDVDADTIRFPELAYNYNILSHLNDYVPVIVNGYETAFCELNPDYSGFYSLPGEVSFDLSSYNIDLIGYGDNVYIPAQTFIDLICSHNLFTLVFNGLDYYREGILTGDINGNGGNDITNRFFNESTYASLDSIESNLAEFNYDELCFALDSSYGLKDHRGISSFDSLFATLGYKERLASTDPYEYEVALANFAGEWLFEGHAGYTRLSPFNYGIDISNDYYDYLVDNSRYIQLISTKQELASYRNAAGLSEGCTIYNNTAVIRFDSFVKAYNTSGFNVDNYSYETLAAYDSPLVFRKAFNEVSANPNVTNVVIDVSMNGGGMLDALPYLLGYTSSIPAMVVEFKNQETAIQYAFSVDLDQDGNFGDTYEGQYNFYCLTSNYSFSCGNAYPTTFKQYEHGRLIGERSGGGSCCVGQISTAIGSHLRSSSPILMGYYDSATSSFKDNEDGIEPDISLDRQYYYDYEYLDNFLNNLD